MPIRVLLVDDHALLREGLRLILEAQRDIVVAGETGSGQEAVELAAQLAPDVVLMDITLPDISGIEATARLCRERPGLRVVVVSMHTSSEHVFRAVQAGASGYVAKESAGSDVLQAVRTVVSGRRYFSSQVAGSVIDELARQRRSADQRGPLESLSVRELEVLTLVAAGHSSAAVGRQLGLSPKTVDTYRSRLMRKLGVADAAGLIRFALEHGVTGATPR